MVSIKKDQLYQTEQRGHPIATTGGDFTLCLHDSDLARRAGGRALAAVKPLLFRCPAGPL